MPKRWHIFKVKGNLSSRPQVAFSETSQVMINQSWLWRVKPIILESESRAGLLQDLPMKLSPFCISHVQPDIPSHQEVFPPSWPCLHSPKVKFCHLQVQSCHWFSTRQAECWPLRDLPCYWGLTHPTCPHLTLLLSPLIRRKSVHLLAGTMSYLSGSLCWAQSRCSINVG